MYYRIEQHLDYNTNDPDNNIPYVRSIQLTEEEFKQIVVELDYVLINERLFETEAAYIGFNKLKELL